MHRIFQKLARGIVTEVPVGGGDTLLEIPGVITGLKHLLIVIRFEHESIRAAYVLLNERRDPPEIRHVHQLESSRSKHESDRIGGIVCNTKGSNRYRPHGEVLARDEELAGARLRDVLHGRLVGIYGERKSATERCNTVYVIGVLVGYQDRLQGAGVNPDLDEALLCLAAGEAAVYEEPHTRGFDERTIGFASGR
jgi:hypothetical protein